MKLELAQVTNLKLEQIRGDICKNDDTIREKHYGRGGEFTPLGVLVLIFQQEMLNACNLFIARSSSF